MATSPEQSRQPASIGRRLSDACIPYVWKPGQSGNPAGRPKGLRARFSEKFCKDFLADWEQHGLEVIEKVRNEKPDVYLRVATAILPKVSDDDDDLNDLSPEELDARLTDLEARTAALVGAEGQA